MAEVVLGFPQAFSSTNQAATFRRRLKAIHQKVSFFY